MHILFLALATFSCGTLVAGELARKVDTRVGMGSGSGSCMVGPCLPNASAYPSPDSLYPFPGRRFPPPSGMHPGDPVVGFSQLHTQGTGGTPSYGMFLLSPALQPLVKESDLASPLTLSETYPFSFKGRLERWGTDVAVIPTRNGALYQIDFPATNQAWLTINAVRKIGRSVSSTNAVIHVEEGGLSLSGGGHYSGCWNPGAFDLYFAMRFERAPLEIRTPERGLAMVRFDTTKQRRVALKVAVSFHSVAQATAYLDQITSWDGKENRETAESAWEEKLRSIRVSGLNPKEERLFYSHLFHCFVQPRDRTGDFMGWPKTAAIWDDHHTVWDTWKTLFPLWSIVNPQGLAGVVNSFSARMRRNGECSVAFGAACEYRTGQGGDDVDNVIADAFAKKIPHVDWEAAWNVLEGNAARRTEDYRTLGWVASDLRHDYCWRMKSGSGTLAFSYNDWCAAKVAEGLGKTDAANSLRARSANWTNVWDAAAVDQESGFSGFVRGRRKNGVFAAKGRSGKFLPAPPRGGYNTDFYEGTCWEYSFVVPHDIPGMIARMGGRERFVARLQYALENKLIDFGNEPSFMTIWLFAFADRPDLTSYWAKQLRKKFPDSGPPGDDDSGAMGSMFVFLSLGFFPIAGQDLYVLHGPSVPKAEIRLPESGKLFTVIGEGLAEDHFYMKEVYLNGKRLTRPFIRHSDILSGGSLRFVMGKEP